MNGSIVENSNVESVKHDINLCLASLNAKGVQNINDEDLSRIENGVRNISGLLKSVDDESTIDSLFELLDRVQTVLAIAVFKYAVRLPDMLRAVVRDCDRLDDIDLRRHLLATIRSNTFPSNI